MKPQINKIIILLIGVTLISFILWNRLLRVREAINLEQQLLNPLQCIGISILIIYFIGLLIYNLRIIYKVKPRTNSSITKLVIFASNNNFIITLTQGFKRYILDAPYQLYDVIYNQIRLRKFVEKTASPIVAYYHYPLVYAIIFVYIPYILVATIFVIDIIYYHMFNMFFKSLILLLIPLITRFYIFILEDVSKRFIYFMNLHLDFDLNSVNQGIIYSSFKKVQPTVDGAWDILNTSLANVLLYWDIHTNIHNFGLTMQETIATYKPYQTLYTSLCYIIGWSYYLWFILDPSLDIFNNFQIFQDNIEPFSGLML